MNGPHFGVIDKRVNDGVALLDGRDIREGLLQPAAQHALAHRCAIVVEEAVDAGGTPARAACWEDVQSTLRSTIQAHEVFWVVQLQCKPPCTKSACLAPGSARVNAEDATDCPMGVLLYPCIFCGACCVHAW